MDDLKPVMMYCCKNCKHLHHDIVTSCDCGTGCDPFEYELWEARRAVPQANAEQDAPVLGYLHIITFETGETTKFVCEGKEHPWGRKGIDFSAEFGQEVVSLVAASKTTPSSGEGSNADQA